MIWIYFTGRGSFCQCCCCFILFAGLRYFQHFVKMWCFITMLKHYQCKSFLLLYFIPNFKFLWTKPDLFTLATSLLLCCSFSLVRTPTPSPSGSLFHQTNPPSMESESASICQKAILSFWFYFLTCLSYFVYFFDICANSSVIGKLVIIEIPALKG